MTLRAALASVLLAATLTCAAATPSLAQHVVTDNEAGKLTLDALTATPAPVFHHVAYRTVSRREAYAPVASRSRFGLSRRMAVREVAWHRPVRMPAAAGRAGAHRRTRRG